VSAYIAVTATYWAFMLTDGALRMLVLLHFHTLGFSPVQLAYLFVLYEIAGVVTNLCAGWISYPPYLSRNACASSVRKSSKAMRSASWGQSHHANAIRRSAISLGWRRRSRLAGVPATIV